MKALSLRASLMAWFIGLASSIVGLASVALYVGVRSSLLAGVDGELQAQAQGIAALCEWEAGGVHLEGAFETAPQLQLFGDGTAAEIRLVPGLELVKQFGPPLPEPPCDALPHDGGDARTFGPDLRVVAMTFAFPARVGAEGADEDSEHGPSPAFAVLIRAGTSLRPMFGQLARIAWIAVLVGLASIGAVVAFGAFLSRRVTVPLERLGAAALRVRDGAEAHIQRRGTGDEIDRLALILDEAFASLRASVERQKRFIADASHELRNPIAILQSASEIALRRARDPEDYATALREVHDVARRMARLVESLLMLTRLDASGHTAAAAVDLVGVVRECVEVADVPDGKSVELRAPTDTTIAGDRHLLGILCGNLLANALRYARQRVVVEVHADEACVRLSVTDDGPGVSAAERDRLFERFYRGEDTGGHAGAGLGLALVAAIAAAHQARTELADASPGLVVRVVFPRRAETGSLPWQVATHPVQPPKRSP